VERLTDRNKELPSLTPENAAWWSRVALRLADYEDSGLSPRTVQACAAFIDAAEKTESEFAEKGITVDTGRFDMLRFMKENGWLGRVEK